MELYYNIAYISFANKQYKESVRWISKIELESYKEDLIQIQTYARLLKLIILFEIGDTYIEYTIRSTYRFLINQNRLLKFEKSIINCLKFIPKYNTSDELQKFYEIVANSLQPLWEDNIEKKNLRSLNLLAWAKSKLHKNSFTEAVRELTTK